MRFSFDKEDPIFKIAHDGKLNQLKESFKIRKEELSDIRASNGSSLLEFAAESGHLRMVQWLLNEGGSKVSETNHQGDTALLLAASEGHLEMVQLLLSHPQMTYRNIKKAYNTTKFPMDAEIKNLIFSKMESYGALIENACSDTSISGLFEVTDEKIIIADSLFCPITCDLIDELVIAKDGHFYEKRAIEEWLKSSRQSPITRQPLIIEYLNPAIPINQILVQIYEEIDSLYHKKAQENDIIVEKSRLRLKKSESAPYLPGKHHAAFFSGNSETSATSNVMNPPNLMVHYDYE